jgi:7,8-dihydroneopterin aldolase/epimerase/oxygenase
LPGRMPACYATLAMDRFNTPPLPAGDGARHFVRGLVVDALLGVYEHEHRDPQRVRLSLDLDTGPEPFDAAEAARWAQTVAMAGHVTLAETLAERIAARCLDDPRIRAVRVRVDKLDIFPDAVVGVEIVRKRG